MIPPTHQKEKEGVDHAVYGGEDHHGDGRQGEAQKLSICEMIG